jgi:hypothetical protein
MMITVNEENGDGADDHDDRDEAEIARDGAEIVGKILLPEIA